MAVRGSIKVAEWERELLERYERGEARQDTAAAMGKSVNTLDTALKRWRQAGAIPKLRSAGAQVDWEIFELVSRTGRMPSSHPPAVGAQDADTDAVFAEPTHDRDRPTQSTCAKDAVRAPSLQACRCAQLSAGDWAALVALIFRERAAVQMDALAGGSTDTVLVNCRVPRSVHLRALQKARAMRTDLSSVIRQALLAFVTGDDGK